MRTVARISLAVAMLFTACTSPSAEITSPPAVIPLQFPPTPTSLAGANAVDAPEPPQAPAEAEDGALSQAAPMTAVPASTANPSNESDQQLPSEADPLADPEPVQSSSASIAQTRCDDANEIRTDWIESEFAAVAREGRGFPTDLLLCEDTPEVHAALECMPFRTERIFGLLADLHGELAAPLLEAPVVFCVDLTG